VKGFHYKHAMKADWNSTKWKRQNQEATVYWSFYRMKKSWTWFLKLKMMMKQTFITKIMKKNLSTILTTLTLIVKSSIRAIAKKSKLKSSQPSICLPSSSMMLSKDSKKTLKRKSLSIWEKYKILCLNKHPKTKKNSLKNLFKSISLIMKSIAMIKHGKNFNNMN